MRNAVSLVRQPPVEMLAPVTLRTFPPIGYSSLPGVENMPWVRDSDGLSLERPARTAMFPSSQRAGVRRQ